MKPSICFFAKVKSRAVLDRVEFYAQDIQSLLDLGFEVRIATALSEICPAELYFLWWWTWAFFPVSVAKLLGRPVVITGVIDLGVLDQRPTWHRQLTEYALSHADANIFVSRMEYEAVPRRFRVQRPFYSPLTVDTALYKPNGNRDQEMILSVGLLAEENAVRKGMPELIRAAPLIHRQHPEVRFVIAGEKGSYYPILAQMVRELGAESYVEFPGVISPEKKIQMMQQCKVYLQPSRFEGFGVAILEAMSCGAAVVTTPVGAVPEVVGDAGLMVEGSSPEQIAISVIRLLDEPELRSGLGTRGRARAESLFSYERRKRELGEVIAEVLRCR
jgi:glycosyltransferase involved in cell wall biosynthesis